MLRCLKDCASRFRDVMILYKLVEVCGCFGWDSLIDDICFAGLISERVYFYPFHPVAFRWSD
jgi:hypothetical protein